MLQLALRFRFGSLCGGAQCCQPPANGLLFLITGQSRPLRQATPLLLQGWFWLNRGRLFFWLRVLRLLRLIPHLLQNVICLREMVNVGQHVEIRRVTFFILDGCKQ